MITSQDLKRGYNGNCRNAPVVFLRCIIAIIFAALLQSSIIPVSFGQSYGTVITITGHGRGHFRGMGQWGAYGYALAGYNAYQIIQHYYGGTSIVTASERLVDVRLTKENYVKVYSPSGVRVGYHQIRPGYAVELRGSQAIVTLGCNGNIVAVFPVQPTIDVYSAQETTESANTMLRFCSDNLPYRGSIHYANHKVYNTVAMKDYLRSVVPAEMPAKWADSGGFEALKAQAIAARSYAIAVMDRWGAIRDSDESQMYLGIHSEDPRTDAAVYATNGQIVQRGGQVMLTEYSASTGGQTVTGLFPGVLDAGDVVSPYHTWRRQIGSWEIAEKFGYDNVINVAPTQLGPPANDGKIMFITSSGNGIFVSAAQFVAKLKLPSAWIDPPGYTF